MDGLVFLVGAEHAPHLERALGAHLRHLRETGVKAPPEIVDLWKWAQTVARGLTLPVPSSGEEDLPVCLLLTLPQVATELGCGVTKVKRLIAEEKLPTVQFEGVRRVRRTDLQDYAARLEPSPSPQPKAKKGRG
jgi:excisionase family DNA binding protein